MNIVCTPNTFALGQISFDILSHNIQSANNLRICKYMKADSALRTQDD